MRNNDLAMSLVILIAAVAFLILTGCATKPKEPEPEIPSSVRFFGIVNSYMIMCPNIECEEV